MGQKHGKAGHSISSKRVKTLAKETNFNEPEINAIAIHFEGISSKKGGEHVIDRNQFKSALGFKDSLFLNRMFMLFDTDGDGQINFEEFVNGISMMCESGDFAEKVQFSFQVYDFDGDGVIARKELTDMLNASISETDIDMTSEQLRILVDSTLKQVAPESQDAISFDMYMSYAMANKDRFQSAMTINIKQRIARRMSSR